jgi:NTE family protein
MQSLVSGLMPRPTYSRGAELQREFENAVGRLRQTDTWTNPATGQEELNADLVLEGGGVKGIGLAGAICVLAEAGYKFPRTAGTSAGAIAAVLVAAVQKSGQDMSVLDRYLRDLRYVDFTRTGRIRHALERVIGRVPAGLVPLLFRGGLYDGSYLNTWLSQKLGECGVTSWDDLKITPGEDPGTDLPKERQYHAVVYASDITRGMVARLPWDYQQFYGLTPEEEMVISAVRGSMSIPFFFVPDRVATKRAEIDLPDDGKIIWPGGKVTWVDGGMLANFPITAFDRTQGAPRWPTIGIKLSAEPAVQPRDRPVRNAVSEGWRCLSTLKSEWDQYHVDETTAGRIIWVSSQGIDGTNFALTKDQQDGLFESGAKAATEFLIKWSAQGGLPRSDHRA